jgi:hypothetical protein
VVHDAENELSEIFGILGVGRETKGAEVYICISIVNG